jgi:hypothetical protein
VSPRERGPPVAHLLPQVQVTGRNGTAGRHARRVVSRRRALGALALASAAAVLATGCSGGGDGSSADLPPAGTAPAAVAAPVAVAAVPPGGTVTAGPRTPKPVAKALAGSKVVVVAFVVDGPADDANVAAAVRAVRGERLARQADFFVYRVGKDKFGDLADLLGVTGTPSVAVIARDRTLANLWTGLTDAEILRQSISDAADTAAANRGAAAAGGNAGGPVGHPEGIALAERANASFTDVPGIAVSGEFPVPNAGTIAVEGELRLTAGVVDGMHGTYSMAGARFEMVASGGAAGIRVDGASCWAQLPGASGAAQATPDPVVLLAGGTRVSAPRREGANDLIDVSAGGRTATYAIDRASGELREMRSAEGTVAFRALDTAPELPDATPVCDDPTDALEGLPEALGGIS